MSLQTIGIGEVVWDLFPSYKRLGGAPYNYAFHCAQLSARAKIISGIGRDDLGLKIKDAAAFAKLDISCLQESAPASTGVVKVSLNAAMKPSYEICADRAWDYLEFLPELSSLALTTDAVCFGTLGQRSEKSRKTIQMFVKACPDSALKIFDINLRQNFFSKSLIEDSLHLSNILKLSDEELPVLTGMFGLSGSIQTQLQQLRRHFELRLIAYTRGPAGSLLLSEDALSEHAGCAGEVVDTVGAGDSFTATLSMGLLWEWPLDRINEYANRVATFVCSQNGATPVLPDEIIKGGSHA